jgi:hypothetical protein
MAVGEFGSVLIVVSQNFLDMREADLETTQTIRCEFVVQTGLVSLAQLARNIQPEPGALLFGGEKRFEQIFAP